MSKDRERRVEMHPTALDFFCKQLNSKEQDHGSCRKRIPLNNRSRQVCVSMTFYNRGRIFEPPCQEDAKNVTFEFSTAIPVATKCFLYVVMTLLFNLSSGIKTEIFGTSEFCSLEQQSSRRI
ncbi:hypothetical protein NPIL_175131 [Nephila pilipes]|uniref:Uncharacterized protein n=1 Tax=Nephila pilipes TaxID=299642 RepID=A0A8X6PDC8_NEPPI|nr:hypothetical protein NPIL_175131 [Nephila pilipes]